MSKRKESRIRVIFERMNIALQHENKAHFTGVFGRFHLIHDASGAALYFHRTNSQKHPPAAQNDDSGATKQ
jgi:hypothetical protein